ncbi:arylamine N-acetyltransferase family protein [Terrabacter sp. 2RAF25]|uniref:arylamine N-acetyltransferase family protein n=1 Tax=Terrabacter sp. 2RAF25 TaxID=3232998 RepID=UPI003F9A6FE6
MTTEALTAEEAAAYLRRLGVPAPEAPTLAALASLHRAHLLTVPFENLDIGLGRPIRLDRTSLVTKIVDQRRGGYCYELNGIFALLLRRLGYAVDLVSARVARADGGLTDEYDHLALVVSSPDLSSPNLPSPDLSSPDLSSPDLPSPDRSETMLADVGFGEGFVEPLPLVDGFERRERGLSVGLARRGELWVSRERRDGEDWRGRFVFTTTPHPLDDFAERNEWQQSSPDSHFTRARLASILTPTGRVTLSSNRLITSTHGRRDEIELEDEAAVLAALARHFGIVLPGA